MLSVNWDETVFPEPDRFDVTRTRNYHDALRPGGPHYCLGAGLARMEARVLFDALVADRKFKRPLLRLRRFSVSHSGDVGSGLAPVGGQEV